MMAMFINATSGDKLWNYTTGGMVLLPAVANGVVYVGGGNTVLCFGCLCFDASPTSPNTLPVIIGVIVAVVIVVAVVFLMFKKRLKTKMIWDKS